MAKAQFEIPAELIRQINDLEHNTEKMMGEMVEAGAKTVLSKIQENAPAAMKKDAELMQCLGTTKVYKTPSDDGINVKVGFSGYFTNQDGQRTPAALVANVFEYGRSTSPYPKQPFIRKSFNKKAITEAMEEVQKKYIKED